MTSEEKIFLILNYIRERRRITIPQLPVTIAFEEMVDELKIPYRDIKTIFHKLSYISEDVLVDVHHPSMYKPNGRFLSEGIEDEDEFLDNSEYNFDLGKRFEVVYDEYKGKQNTIKKNDNTFDLSQFSQGNLDRIYKVLTVIIEALEIFPYNRLTQEAKIPLALFKKKGLTYNEVKGLIIRISEFEKGITFKNDELLKKIIEKEDIFGSIDKNEDEQEKKELETNIVLSFHSPVPDIMESLKKVKKQIEDQSTDTPEEKYVSKDNLSEDVIYKIDYNEKQKKIFINGILLATLHFDSSNERFFTYVYKNPNKKISLGNIEKELGTLNKKTNDILKDIGFTHDFRKVFFNASKDSVIFYNPINKQHLTEVGVDHLSFQAKKDNKEK